MLELSEGWDGPIPDLLTKLTKARDISVFLEEATFPHKLTIDGIFFPTAASKYQEIGFKAVNKLSCVQLTALKKSLSDDVEPLIKKAYDDYSQMKAVLGETMPVDFQDCTLKLEDIRGRKRAQIVELQKDLEKLDNAEYMLGVIEKNNALADKIIAWKGRLPTDGNKKQRT